MPARNDDNPTRRRIDRGCSWLSQPRSIPIE
jgi:hypothetical protein